MKITLLILLSFGLTVFSQNISFFEDIDINSMDNEKLVQLSNYCDSIIEKKERVNDNEFKYLSEILENIKIDSIKFRILVLKGDYYYFNEDYINLVKTLKEAIKIAENNKYSLYYYNVNNTLGIAHYQLGKYDEALDYYYKALKFSTENDIIMARFDVYQNIGLLFLKLEDYTKANYYYTKAYELKDSITDENFIAGLLVNMANMNRYHNDNIDKSLEYNNQALLYYKKTDNIIGITSVYNNIGDIYEIKKDYDKALNYYKKANINFIKINYKFGICVTYYNMSSVYFLENNFISSKKNIDLSLIYADSINNIEMKRDIYKKLSEIQYKISNYKESLNSYKDYILLRDSIINTNRIARLNDLKLKHKQKEVEIHKQKLKKEKTEEQLMLLMKKDELSRQRYTTVILILLSVILVLIALFIFYRYRKLNIKFSDREEEIKNTQNYLKTSEARFKILFEESPDAIFVEDSEGVILDVNNATCKLYKKTKEQIIGKNIRDLSPDIEKDNIITDLNYWISRKQKIFRSYAHLDNGEKIPIDIKFSIIDFDGEKAGLFIVRNISNQIEIEEKLKAEKVKFIKADSLKSLFLSNISHEIRTPMNAIIGFSDLLKNNKLSEEKINYYSEIIINNSEILIKSIEDIIDVSKLESNSLTINYSDCHPKIMFKDTYDYYLPKAKVKDLELNLFIDETFKDKVRTDQYRCRQIIDNLLSNAIKFTELGKIDYGFKVNADIIEIFVYDTGIGIPEDKMEYVFDPFYQIQYDNNLNYGTGLGLPIIKRITELLGGEIYIDSKLGEGTKISCKFPINPSLS